MSEDMTQSKYSSGGSAAAAPAVETTPSETPVEQFCSELAKIFNVRPTEIALLRIEHGLLKFLFPKELTTAGAIPVSSSGSIAAHTASSRKVELFNSFLKVKHASVFESVKLTEPETLAGQLPIQRIMSAPVLHKNGHVLGVVQVCRKGVDLSSSGPEFSLEDLHQLEHRAELLAQCDFMLPAKS